MSLSDSLINLGLTENEATIYSTLSEVGPCFVAPLVQKTKKHRQMVYNALEELQEKHLVSVSKKNGKNFYGILEPSRLLINAKQKVIEAKEVVDRINKKTLSKNESVTVFRGPSGYEDGLADFRARAEQSKEYIVIGGEEEKWYQEVSPFFQSHVKELQKLKHQGVDVYILFYENDKESAEKNILPYVNNPYKIKVADEALRLPQTTWISGNYVYLLTPVDEPLVISIQSQRLASAYRDLFWKQWKTGTVLS